MRINFFKLLLLITMPTMSCGDLLAQVNWTKYTGNPLGLLNGAPGSWNRNVCEASVLYNTDSSRYEMWFSGTSGNPVFPYKIGFAKSVDGISWDLHPDPVLTPTSGTWDQYNVQFPFVIRENGLYKMWYSSSPQSDYNQCKIGYATSPDGIEWTKDTLHNPIFGPGTDPWEAGGVMACYVMPVTGGYKIWYSGFTTSAIDGNVYIGYATSADGISWQRNTINNPVLEPGVTGLWDGKWVWYPQILLIDNVYYMYYAGTNIGYWGTIEVGLATSTDGITQWTKHSQNPVLSPSTGMWDGQKVEASSVKLIGDSLWMWYSGNGSFLQMGLATSSPVIPVPVELISFTAKSNGEEVILNWSTATELNNLGFEVQRSSEGKEFLTVGFVKGSGTSSEQHNYTFYDRNLNNGKYYYRLKQVDFNGSYEYSDVIEEEWRAFNSYLLEQNYPNPFNPVTTIGYGIQEKSNVKITILNIIGEEVAVILNEEKEAGYHQVEFKASTFPSGVYFYQLRAGYFIETKKMILLR